MIFRKTIIIFILLVIFTKQNIASSQNNPENQLNTLATKQIMLMQTTWPATANPAALTYYEFNQRIASAFIYSEFQDKKYNLFQGGNKLSQTGFFTEGYISHNRWKFFGSFDYFSQLEKNTKWVSVMEPYNDNPYTVGDSIGGNYTKEYFNMEGKGAFSINEKLSFGFNMNYSSGVGAKRKDPRPENTITTFDFIPGIIYGFNKIKLGINFHYQNSNEEIDFSSVTSKTNYLFHFKGLGVYTSTSEYDKRIHISNLMGSGFQFSFSGDKINNLTEIRFHKKQTDIKRGVTYPLQVVLLEKYNTEVLSEFLFTPAGKNLKKLSLFYFDKHLYGHEPVVEPKPEAVSYQWSTVEKYTLYWHRENEFGFDYTLYNILDKNHFNWGVQFSGKMNLSETTYYFVPEINRQNLNLLFVKAKFEKGFQFEKSELIFSIDGGYRKGFNNKLKIVEDKNLLSTVNTDFVTHDYEYYDSTLTLFGASVKFGKNINVYKTPLQIFIDSGVKSMFFNRPGINGTKIMEIKLGMNF